MKIDQAIILFSLSEKIKTGLIWATQSVEAYSGCDPKDKSGAEKMISALSQMIAREIVFARKITGEEGFYAVEKNVDLAIVMIRSGVVAEAAYHFSRALSSVTSIGQRAMTTLKETGLL